MTGKLQSVQQHAEGFYYKSYQYFILCAFDAMIDILECFLLLPKIVKKYVHVLE